MNILALPTLAIALLFMVYFYKLNNDILNPGAVFNFMWAFSVVLQMINYGDFYEISEKTYAIVLLGIVCVNIGLLLADKYTLRIGSHRPSDGDNNQSYDERDQEYVANRGRKVFIVQCVLFVLLIPLFMRSLQFQAQYGMAAMRTIYAQGVEYGYMTTFERIMYIHLGVFPLNMACNLAQAVLCMRGESKIRYLLVGFANEGMHVMIAASRNNLFVLAVAFLCVILMRNNLLEDILPDRIVGYIARIRRYFKQIIVVLIVLMAVITFYRNNMATSSTTAASSFLTTAQVYFAGGFQLFDLALANPAEWGLDSLTFGGATFCGLIGVLNYIIYYILSGRRISIAFLASNIQTYAEEFYAISSTKKMNAYVTMFYYFMRDFGIFGVIVFSVIFGWVCTKIYNRAKRNPSFWNQYLMVAILIVVIFSVEWWQPIKSDWWMMLIYGYILYKWLYGGKYRISVG